MATSGYIELSLVIAKLSLAVFVSPAVLQSVYDGHDMYMSQTVHFNVTVVKFNDLSHSSKFDGPSCKSMFLSSITCRFGTRITYI